MKTCELKIQDLAFDGGKGVGRTQDGKVVFVPETCPGELVKVEILKEKKSYSLGRLVEVLKPAPERQEPSCPIYKQCGGCNLQHMSYAQQTRSKQNLLIKSLKRFGFEDTKILNFVPSDKTWRYRNRLEAHYQNGKWGFYQPGSHQLVSTNDCLIADVRLIEKLNQISFAKEDVLVSLSPYSSNNIQISTGRKRGLEGQFAQANSGINEKIKASVVQWTESHDWDQIVDYYAGSGNFGHAISQQIQTKASSKKIHCVELSQTLVEEGRKKTSHLKNLYWHCMACESFDLSNTGKQNLVILDPPRTGCSASLLKTLTQTKSIQSIIYISCNPPIGFRDLKLLKENFHVTQAQAFDMFPQTMHFEAIFFLERL